MSTPEQNDPDWAEYLVVALIVGGVLLWLWIRG